MKVLYVLFLLLVRESRVLAENKVEIIAPILIEAEQEKKSVEQAVPHSTIDLPSGIGAASIDAPINKLGISQGNMEDQASLLASRPYEEEWLRPLHSKKKWVYQGRMDISLDPKLQLQVGREGRDYEFNVKAGIHIDRRDLIFSNTRIPYYRDAYFLQLATRGPAKHFSWESLSDMDALLEDVYARAIRVGERKKLQSSLNAELQVKNWKLKPFMQFQGERFVSDNNYHLSNKTLGLKGGLQAEVKLPWLFKGALLVYQEWFSRKKEDGLEAEFNRSYGKGYLVYENPFFNFFEVLSELRVEFFRDTLKLPSLSDWNCLWDLGLEVSTTRRLDVGWRGLFRKYAKIPTATQRFGDGALIQSSPSLPPETGIRFATGPWWKGGFIHQEGIFQTQAMLFGEAAQQVPLMVGVSPVLIRAKPLGGVWALGGHWEGRLEWQKLKVFSELIYQQVINASEIDWQKGRNVPGRPPVRFQLNVEYALKGFKIGGLYGFKSKEALDVQNLLHTNAQHQVEGFIGYGRKNWEFRILAINWIPNNPLPNTNGIQGLSGEEWLTYRQKRMELRLQCEIYL